MTRPLALALLLAAAACSHDRASSGSPGQATSSTAAPAPGPAGSQQRADAMCPLALPGARVAAAETPDGAALEFTAGAEQVAELRRRVHAMAELHERRHAGGAQRAAKPGAHAHGDGDGCACGHHARAQGTGGGHGHGAVGEHGCACGHHAKGQGSGDATAEQGRRDQGGCACGQHGKAQGAMAGHGHGHGHGGGGMHHGSGMMRGHHGDGATVPPARVSVQEIPSGARLVITPEDAGDLERLRTFVRARAERMQQHGCEMMGAHHGA